MILLENINPKNLKKVEKVIKGTQNEFIKTLVNFLSKILGFSVLESVNHFLKLRLQSESMIFKKYLKVRLLVLKKIYTL